MAYTPDNNPYIPGDPYSYDLKWQVDNIKHMQDRFGELDDQVQEATDQADRAEQEADRAAGRADFATEEADRATAEADRAIAEGHLEVLKAEGFATGTQEGTPVTEESPYYQNNSEYFSQQAAGSAEEAREYADNIADPVAGLVTSWLAHNITQPTTPAIDTSLTVAGAAADAQVAGNGIRSNGELSEIATAIASVNRSFYGDLEQGAWTPTGKGASTTRLRTYTPFFCAAGTYIKITAAEYLDFRITEKTDKNATAWDKDTDWMQANRYITGYSHYIATNCYVYLNIRKRDQSEILPVDFTGTIEIIGECDFISMANSAYSQTGSFIYSELERGSYVNGIKYWPPNYSRLRSAQRLPAKKGTVIKFTSATLEININELATPLAESSLTLSGWQAGTDGYSYTVQNDCWITLSFRYPDDAAIYLENYDGITEFISPLAKTLDLDSIGKKSGKNLHIYHFGGKGNDWCFVRTPANYDYYRSTPYPFVICNHGNGWNMNGTPQYANWTKRTMYVPLDDPDYIANPDEYNGTADSSLWYSNPTIEALLAAGYIVCGCENYGDLLYGNDNCREACAAFYEHMVNTYNVPDWCYMIGCSNGAQTTINAAYILRDRIKAMILQYPLTCLIEHYLNYEPHRAGIRAAYNIEESNPTEEHLIDATRTHDLLHTDIINGVKLGYYPPVQLYYSPDDAVINWQHNSALMDSCLDSSLKVVEMIECSGEHGDHSHFQPANYVAFFNKYNPLANS